MGVSRMRCFFFFIDGLGLAPVADSDHNPLLRADLPNFLRLSGGQPLVQTSLPFTSPAFIIPTDANLGVPGLPQSASGQTTMLTGVNGPAAIGRHLNGYPSPRLRAIIAEHSLLKRAHAQGYRTTFLNAYTPGFQEWLAAGMPSEMPGLEPTPQKRQRLRPSASTVATLAAAIPFRGLPELLAGQAVFHDITRATLRERGFDAPLITPSEAGRHAAAVMAEHDLVFYEHFLTDIAGHSQEMDRAVQVLEMLDEFLGALLACLPSDVLLLITSDHGNIEDLSVKTHTRNPVPTILYGPGARAAAGRVQSLLDITPVILAALADAF